MLKIWMPFTTDDRNIGLMTYKKMTIDNLSSANDDTFGKVGYGIGLFHCDQEEFENAWTIAMWVKRAAWTTNGSNDILCCKNTSASTYCQWYFSQVSGKLNIGVNAGAGSYSVPFTFTNNVWIHVAAVYDGKTVFLYGNGELLGSKELNSAMLTGCTNIGISCRSMKNDGSSYTGGNSYLSDFRIYSHALKDWEIKKIYNDMSFGIEGGLHLKATTNLMAGKDYSVSNLTTNCTTQNDADGGKYVMTTTRVGSYTSDSIRLQFPSTVGFTDGKDYSISYDYKVGAGSGNLHQGLDVNDGTPVVKVTDKESGMKRVEVIVESGTPHYSYSTYRFIDFNKIAQNSKYKIWRMQVEEGKTPTPYTPSHRDERYIDLSGIDNEIVPYNITQSGSSFYFNGTNAAIKIPLHKMISGGTWSINLWFYRPNGEFGTKSWETLVGGQSGFELEATSSSTKTLYVCPYSWGGGKFAYEADRWNMVTLTRTSSGSKLYINGSLVKSGSAGSMPTGDYFIGAWKTYAQQNFKGYIRNLSVFQKQLTDEDIMNLYIHGE